MAFDRPPETTVAWSTKILERVKIELRTMIGEQVIENMRIETFMAREMKYLVVRLTTELLREKVLEDTADVPFSTTVNVRVPVHLRRRSAFAGFLLAVILTYAAIMTQTLLLGAAAASVAAIASWTLTEQPPDARKEIDVCGDVTVRADYFNTFPHNDEVLPPELGGAVRVMMYEPIDYSLSATARGHESQSA